MKEYRLTDMEAKFADLIWANEPIPSGNLVKMCEIELNWKKSTTYTMLKRLESKKIFENRNSMVSAVMKRDEFYSEQSKQFVEETFEGSLPKFLVAFTKSKKLSKKEIDALEKLIDAHKEE